MYRNDKCVSAHFSCYCQASIPVSIPLPSLPSPLAPAFSPVFKRMNFT